MNVEALMDRDIAEALKSLPMMDGFDFAQVPSMREARKAQLEIMRGQLSDRVERTEYKVPAADGAPDVTFRFHRPKDATGELPCVYFMHGGGYVFGSCEMDDLRFDRWCQELNCAGISVEYRLAPETPYPGPLEDCYTGLKWAYDHAEELGIDRARLGIGGASAGGGLAAGLALLARDRGEVPLAFQLLIYPMIDDRRTNESATWEVPIWSPRSNEAGWRAYLGPLFESNDIPGYAAATRANDVSGLPPAYVMVGALDGFLDEDVEYAMRMMRAGVPVELHVYPGGPHGFDGLLPGTALARRARLDIEEWLRRQFAR